MSDMLATVKNIRANLEQLRNPELTDNEEVLLQLLKVGEEAGEVCEKAVNMFQQNFRKKPGPGDTPLGIAEELIDTSVTALVAAGFVMKLRLGWTEQDIDEMIQAKLTFLLGRTIDGVRDQREKQMDQMIASTA